MSTEIVFTIPGCWTAPGVGADDGKVHFEMEIAAAADFSGTLLVDTSSLNDQTGWTYSDGTEWVAWDSTGILAYIQRLDPLEVGGYPMGTGNSNTDPDYRADVKQGYAGYSAKFSTAAALGDPGDIVYYRWRQYDVGAVAYDTEWHLGSLMLPAGSSGAAVAATTTPSTLRLNYMELIERVADYMGMGMSPSGDNLARVRNIINDGYANFLFPPPIPASRGGLEPDSHNWTFLSPTTTLTLVVDDNDYTLPDNFGGLIGTFSYPSDTPQENDVAIVDEGYLRRLISESDLGGDPYYVAIRVKSNDAANGPVWEALFYPRPSTARDLTYRYQVEYNKLDTPLVSGTAAITGDADGYMTLTDTTGDFASVVSAGNLVILSGCSGPTAGIYTVVSTSAVAPATTHTVITLATTATSAGTCNYEVLDGTVYPVCPLWCHQALIEMMLDVAARRHDDEVSGAHREQSLNALSAAVRRDRMLFREQNLGKNSDSSDGSSFTLRSVDMHYNGVAIS